MRSDGQSVNVDVFDAVTLGETMAAFVRADAPDRYALAAIGAESNVAVGMAQLGCKTRWISRLGRDDLGQFIRDTIAGYGVDASVDFDPEHSTGVCVKEIKPEGTRVRYYRRDSAASLLGAADLARIGTARWLHVTGVTPALSLNAAETVAAVMNRLTGHTGRISFDVNYRPVLWPSVEKASQTLVSLARAADVIFIGDDEAQSLLGTSEDGALARELLVRDDQRLIIKRGGGHATAVTTGGGVSEPAGRTQIVDLTGAGDAFAAGYLTGACWGLEARQRLRLGHFLASRVIGVVGDIGPTPEAEELARLCRELTTPSQQRNDEA